MLAAGGDYAGALALYQQALAGFQAANPMAAEPLTLFTRKMDAVSAQMSSLGSVTSVTPGSTDPVFAPDSIVDAYGSGLANTTVSASGSLSTALGGTTVTITDSKGTSVLAPLFYVSPAQVNYAAPASLALGQATVTVKSGDSSTRNGTGTIVDVQPGVFTFNAAGLVAGSIVRATDTRQVLQNVYAVDGAGNVVAAPVAVSKDQVYMVFYATGIRRALAEPGDGFHRWCQRAGGLFRHARFLHRTRSGERAAAGVAGGPRGCAGDPQRSGKASQYGAAHVPVGAWFTPPAGWINGPPDRRPIWSGRPDSNRRRPAWEIDCRLQIGNTASTASTDGDRITPSFNHLLHGSRKRSKNGEIGRASCRERV